MENSLSQIQGQKDLFLSNTPNKQHGTNATLILTDKLLTG